MYICLLLACLVKAVVGDGSQFHTVGISVSWLNDTAGATGTSNSSKLIEPTINFPYNPTTHKPYNLGTIPDLVALQYTIFANSELNDELKKQSLEGITIPGRDRERLATSAGNPIYQPYDYIPIPRSANDTMALEGIINPNYKAGCCSLPENTTLVGNSSHALAVGSFPLKPWDDGFYEQLPYQFSTYKVGQVIGYRRIAYDVSYYPEGTRAYQISYRSESSITNATEVDVTTVVIPRDHDNQHMVSYQTSENSAFLICSPSYQFATGINDPILNMFLKLGYVVNMPDYEGFDTAFSATIRQGKSVLNSIRAYSQLREVLGLENNVVYLYGYSGGAGASLSAAELSTVYAPELIETKNSSDKGTIQGVIVGGLNPNWTQTLLNMNEGTFAGYVPMSLMSLAAEYATWRWDIAEAIPGAMIHRFSDSVHACSNTVLLNFIGQDILGTLKTGSSFLNQREIQQVLDSLNLGQHGSAPPMPVYIFHGSQDELTKISDIDLFVSRYCELGVKVKYRKDMGYSHIAEQNLILKIVPGYLEELKSGILPNTCT